LTGSTDSQIRTYIVMPLQAVLAMAAIAVSAVMLDQDKEWRRRNSAGTGNSGQLGHGETIIDWQYIFGRACPGRMMTRSR
jgi:hypothetical protein